MTVMGLVKIDPAIREGLADYFAHGKEAEPFVMALVRNDSAAAHELAKDFKTNGGEDFAATMLSATQSALPVFAMEDAVEEWMAHSGLAGASDDVKIMSRIMVENRSVYDTVKEKYPEVLIDPELQTD